MLDPSVSRSEVSGRKDESVDETSQVHELKTWPGYFQKIVDGRKNFEARVNDRVFMEGDTVVLREWDPDSKQYTGRTLTKRVGYVAHKVDRLPPPEVVREHGISVFALLDVEAADA